MAGSQDVTQLLIAWQNGEQAALDRLAPIVQAELHRIAQRHMRKERPGHTLETGALINEAYLRLVDQTISWQSRAHFFGIAAKLMRQILIDHARKLGLPLEGLMCIPPTADDAAPHFAFLAKLARDHGLAQLSMGMSGDFELAVKFGATHVRVGTAIFGARQPIAA